MVASRTIGWLGALGAVAVLLLTAGCGCTEDAFGGGGNGIPLDRISEAQIGMEIPAVEVPVRTEVPVKVDVMFLLDDSVFITESVAQPGASAPRGAILGEGVTPLRIKSQVAQQVFDEAVQDLLGRVIADHGGAPSDYDLAFGVSRFEDYAAFERQGPKASNPAEVAEAVDAEGPFDVTGAPLDQSRPFILNQPILRQEHGLFAALFGPALARTAPGNGGEDPQDAQSALEALYQLATGAGFDGNGDGTTTESGLAGVFATQTAPGPSGDVPAPDFVEDGTDDDDEPVYELGQTRASGNLGGAGWRPDSIRLVVVFSDICTITMLEEDLDPEGPVSNTPNASNVPGEPGAGPRTLETVASAQAFACTTGENVLPDAFPNPKDPVSQQAYARFGPVDGTIAVAPVGPTALARGALLQETIDALNMMNIEVLCIGIRQQIDPGPNKPNVPGPIFPGQNEVEAIPNPSVPPNDKSPFTWMSAVSILTGAFDTDLTDPDPRWVPGLPLVYNLTHLNPPNAPVTDDLVEDLSDRIGAWLPYVDRGGQGTEGDPGFVYYTVVLSLTNTSADLALSPLPFALVPSSDPDGHYVSQVGDTQVVKVACYWAGTPPAERPDPLRVAWQFRTDRVDEDTILNALIAQLPFNFTTSLTSAASVPGGKNPTGGHDPADVAIPGAVSGAVTTTYALVPEGTQPQDVPDGDNTVTSVTSGATWFRDLVRGIPAGTSLGTMHGPITAGDVPYPAP